MVGETTERRDRQGSGDSNAGVAESDRLEMGGLEITKGRW